MHFLKMCSILLVYIFLSLGLLSCSKKNKEVVRLNQAGVSQSYSSYRAKNVSNVSYIFDINLLKAESENFYTGTSQIEFSLKNKIPLTLDFLKGEVLKITSNGKEVKTYTKNDNFIIIPSIELKQGGNSIVVEFKQDFSKTGSGFYKFTDKKDKNTYVYTDFEPYDANLFAPIFDQPNLKAKYTLSVKTPKKWKVISSVQEKSKEIIEGGENWVFPTSKKFSTYIFSLHAGPYRVWRKTALVNGRKIPMGLFARESLADFVKPDFWFKISESGFKYFEDYFSTPYPYDKYDQVLVPDFNSGAMENVAAVTFNEAYVSRAETPLRSQRRGLANVIMHEMAHMWFGNLVTMDWWNDLWLNESFATFMANSATSEATEFNEAWLSFFNRTKQWAYSEDQWRTTHPIEAQIDNTEEAMANFDGITYGKGASSLKQLVFLIGVESFKKGLKDYFGTYAEKNTKLVDFIGKLQAYTKEDLNLWTKSWLQRAGLNNLKLNPICKDGSLEYIEFEQGFVSGDKTYRPHKTKVALWTKSEVTSKPDTIFDYRYSGKLTKWVSKNKIECPKAVFPNWEDHDYVKVTLDDKSLEAFSSNLSKIDSPLLRSQVWSSLWSMVRMAELKPEKMHKIIIDQIYLEKDSTVLGSIVGNVTGRGGSKKLYFYYKDQELAKKERAELTQVFKNKIVSSKDIDIKKTLFSGWVSMSQEENVASLKSCLKKCDFDIGFKIDQDRRWWLIQKIAVYRDSAFEYLLESEIKRDNGRRAQLSALSAKALFAKDKKVWLDKVFDEKTELALKEKSAILSGIASNTQRNENLEFIDKSFKAYSDKVKDQPSRVQRVFAFSFAPFFCGDKKSELKIDEDFIKNSEWSPGFKKTLLQSLDREERCLKIKSKG